MRLPAIFILLTFTIVLFCCLHETFGHLDGKLKLLGLLKAALIIKALKSKKIVLPLPIPIGLHHGSGHHHKFQVEKFDIEPFHDIHEFRIQHGDDYGHGHGYGHGYGHGPYEYKTTGYNRVSAGWWWH